MIARLLALLLLLCPVAAGAAGRETAPPAFIADKTVMLVTEPDRALADAERSIARFDSDPTARTDGRLASALWVAAQAEFRRGDVAATRTRLAEMRLAIPTGNAGRQLGAYAYLLDGLLARSEGNIGQALDRLHEAQGGFIASGDRRGQGLALQSVGVLYNDVGLGEDALRYLRLASDVYRGDDIFRLSLLNNFGVAYQSLGRYTEAYDSFVAAGAIAEKLRATGLHRLTLINIAGAALEASQTVDAQAALNRAGPIPASSDGPLDRELLRIHSLLELQKNRPERAAQLIARALDGVSTEDSEPAMLSTHLTAYRVYSALGRSDDAVRQLDAAWRLNRQDAEVIASNRSALLAAQFQFAAQDTRIAQLKAGNLERQVAFQRTISILIIVGGVLLSGLLGVLLVTAIRARNRARSDGEQLAQVNCELQRALAAKTEFLASTSHELRTPLNGILGMTQIILADSGLTPPMRARVELMHDAGSAMRALVDDILDVAKIDHGGFVINPAPANVGALVEKAAALFSQQASESGIRLECTADLPDEAALVDGERLTQILFNLIGNALKFTHEGSISVDAGLRPANGGDSPVLAISVTDTGEGIAPEWHEAVFEMFRQVDGTRTRKHGGTGLGLAICRQLARAMGGDIELRSEAGAGSCFTVTMPWEPVAVPASRPVAEAPVTDAGDVAVVGADPLRSSILTTIVQRAGRKALLVDTAEAIIAAGAGGSLTLLIDAAALPGVGRYIGEDGGRFAHIIVAGDAGDAGTKLDKFTDSRTNVAFSRNAIAEALARKNDPAHNQDLPDDPPDGLAEGESGLANQQVARMSRV